MGIACSPREGAIQGQLPLGAGIPWGSGSGMKRGPVSWELGTYISSSSSHRDLSHGLAGNSALNQSPLGEPLFLPTGSSCGTRLADYVLGLGLPSLSGGWMARALVLGPSHSPISASALPQEHSKSGGHKLGHSPALQPRRCLSGLVLDTPICHPLGEELPDRL